MSGFSVTTLVSDVDDTITTNGLLLPCALEAMYRLRESGRHLVLLTGGSAGWADVYVRQWPVDLVIAESGAVALSKTSDGRIVYRTNPAIPADVEKRRASLIGRIGMDRLSSDQYARLYDIALDLSKVSKEELEETRRMAEEAGAHTSQSSIHLNIWFGDYSKLSGLRHFLGQDIANGFAYAGDSLPDQELFASFPLSFGVASVRDRLSDFSHLPTVIVDEYGGQGFAHIVSMVLE